MRLELLAGEVDDEAVGVLAGAAVAPRGDDPPAGRAATDRRRTSTACRRRRPARRPSAACSGTQNATMLSLVSDLVGISTSSTWPVAPVAVRHDPGARALVGARLEVLIVIEVAVALDQPEALRVRHAGSALTLQRARVVERPPQPLAAGEVEQQAVGVVHLGTEVLELPRACSRRGRTCWSAARCRASSPRGGRRGARSTATLVCSPGWTTKR